MPIGVYSYPADPAASAYVRSVPLYSLPGSQLAGGIEALRQATRLQDWIYRHAAELIGSL